MEKAGLVDLHRMDKHNKKAYGVLKNQGDEAAVEYMLIDPEIKGPNGEDVPMSYAKMRSYYG